MQPDDDSSIELDDDTMRWLRWKAVALTQGRIGPCIAYYLRLAMEDERERGRLGLTEEQALPVTSWTALGQELAVRAEPGRRARPAPHPKGS
jgi:hypothetical protein